MDVLCHIINHCFDICLGFNLCKAYKVYNYMLFVPLIEKNVYFVLEGFTDNLFALIQSFRAFRSILTCEYIVCRSVPVRYTVVSSANNIDFNSVI